MNRLLIDTNAYSGLLSGRTEVQVALDKSDQVYFSVVVTGELLAGFKGGSKEEWNIGILKRFMENPKVSIVEISLKTASIFAGIKHYLRKAGTPVPINDVWIAAQAYEHDAMLVTYDKHFRKIPRIEVWDKVESK